MARRWLRALRGKTEDQQPPLGWLDEQHGLLAELGRGSTCIVYKARSQEGEVHALKVPLAGTDCLLREARFTQSIDSPNVVRCLGMQGDALKMEMLEGETLAQRLSRRGRLKLSALSRLLEELLAGLEAVHALGVVHTDLKPGNLFLARNGRKEQLKLMDFGLALREGERRLAGAQGTAVYAAPEQWGDEPLDRRADLYSVGVVLFEMATGLLPWSAEEPSALLALKRQALIPPLNRYRADLSAEREQLLVDLMRPLPEQRPASIAEVRARWAQSS